MFSTEATANPESSAYGHKADKIGSGPLKSNPRFVDLRRVRETYGEPWLGVLKEIESNWSIWVRSLNATNARKAYELLVGHAQWIGIMPKKRIGIMPKKT